MWLGGSRGLWGVLASAGLVAAVGCGSNAAPCSAPEIEPHLSPAALGDFYPLGSGETPDPGSGEKVPFEWVLLLSSNCETPLVIDKVCIEGDAHNNNADDPAFTIEGPVPATVPFGEQAAVRLTYDPSSINQTDDNSDGKADPDNVAVVIQSNAVNFPTLVVPVCARMVPNGQAKERLPCGSPIVITPGERNDALCQ